jgi:hypothetical protein
MSAKQWDLYCNLTLNGSEQASKECKNCSNKALCLRDTAVLPYLSTLQSLHTFKLFKESIYQQRQITTFSANQNI